MNQASDKTEKAWRIYKKSSRFISTVDADMASLPTRESAIMIGLPQDGLQDAAGRHGTKMEAGD